MANKETTKVQKKEAHPTDVERTRSGRSFVPYTDIIEREDSLTVVLDVPGAVEKDIDIHLEDSVLTVHAKVNEETLEGFRPLYAEYSIGDFQRSFKLSEDVNADKIAASLKNGVLTLDLPKSEKRKPRKIEIKS